MGEDGHTVRILLLCVTKKYYQSSSKVLSVKFGGCLDVLRKMDGML